MKAVRWILRELRLASIYLPLSHYESRARHHYEFERFEPSNSLATRQLTAR